MRRGSKPAPNCLGKSAQLVLLIITCAPSQHRYAANAGGRSTATPHHAYYAQNPGSDGDA
jgi:hypothetical protein